MLDALLTDLEEHSERIVTRLEDIKVMRTRLDVEEKHLQRELKVAHTVFASAKKTIDAAVRRHNLRVVS